MAIPECLSVKKLEKQEVLAIKAVYAGTADAFQQRMTLSIIVNKFCRTHDQLWIPGEPDQTSFLNGRAFPGNQIMKHLNLPVGKLTDEELDDG